jgi:hypothetical protein
MLSARKSKARYFNGLLHTLRIGGYQFHVSEPNQLLYVPIKYAHELECSTDTAMHIKWLAQKDKLGQDCFLVGPPGPFRRRLALSYCEMARRESEVLTISQDTTEADLKQRREIVNGCAIYVDQAPVRAALEGRVLIVDGIEKAERNVLPTLNNLLENREMALSDGRFLVSPQRFDSLLAVSLLQPQILSLP